MNFVAVREFLEKILNDFLNLKNQSLTSDKKISANELAGMIDHTF